MIDKKEFFKYSVVGIVFAILTLFVYWMFSDMIGIPAWIVTLFYIPVSFTLRFFANKHYVFKNDKTKNSINLSKK